MRGHIKTSRQIRHDRAKRKTHQKNGDGLKGWREAVTYKASEGMALVAQRSDG